MAAFQIGVMVDSFRLELEEGIKKAREVGATGIQIYATYGRMAPENLNAAQRKEILDIIKELKRMGKAVIMVIHDLNSALSISDKVCLMDRSIIYKFCFPAILNSMDYLGPLQLEPYRQIL